MLTAVNVCYRTEIKQGAEILAEKIKKYRPKIAVFNGKGGWTHFILFYFSSIPASACKFRIQEIWPSDKSLCTWHFVYRKEAFMQ